MSIQIKAIGLYNNKNEFHLLKFTLNTPNIITGDKDTGKSSVLAIINYCLCGNNSIGIKDKVLALVEFYGLHLVNIDTEEEMLVIRQKPKTQGNVSDIYYMCEGKELEFPQDIIKEVQRYDHENVRARLGYFIGLEPDFYMEDEAVSIRHPLSLNFLSYSDLADESVCFHEQNSFFHFKGFKDFFPYFLGTETIELARDRQEIRTLKREIYNLKNQKRDIETFQSKVDSDSTFNNIRNTFQLSTIEDILKFNLDDLTQKFGKKYQNLDKQLQKSIAKIRILEKRKNSLENFQEIAKLKSNTVVVASDETLKLKQCPICAHKIEENTLVLDELQKDIQIITGYANSTEGDIEGISLSIAEEKKLRDQLEKQLLELPLMNDSHDVSELIFCAEFIGKIRQFFKGQPDISFLVSELEDKGNDLKLLKEKISKRELDPKNGKIIDDISRDITNMLKNILNSEQEVNVYLDINRLLPIENGQQGSGGTSHKISRQIAVYLALHKYFIEHKRPIPRFLIIDQFSQANSGASIDDTQTIVSILKNIFKIEGLQPIILEHIDYSEKNQDFREYVIQKWKTKESGLLPSSWINEVQDDTMLLT